MLLMASLQYSTRVTARLKIYPEQPKLLIFCPLVKVKVFSEPKGTASLKCCVTMKQVLVLIIIIMNFIHKKALLKQTKLINERRKIQPILYTPPPSINTHTPMTPHTMNT